MTDVTELECFFVVLSSFGPVRCVCACVCTLHTPRLSPTVVLFFSSGRPSAASLVFKVPKATEVFYFHLICRSFILFPGYGQTVTVPLKSWRKKRMPERETLTRSSGSPSPFRNLLTPLGSGSGFESRYSATRTSNRPGTQNMIKYGESHCSSIHDNPVLFFLRAGTCCDSLNFGHMSALIWFHYTPAFSHSTDTSDFNFFFH